jgi:hypothetical protein
MGLKKVLPCDRHPKVADGFQIVKIEITRPPPAILPQFAAHQYPHLPVSDFSITVIGNMDGLGCAISTIRRKLHPEYPAKFAQLSPREG